MHEDAKSTAQRTARQSVKQSWDCSQIENEEEDEEVEEILERRRMVGSSLQAEVMRNVPELVEHERMSQGEKVQGTKEKKKVRGWD